MPCSAVTSSMCCSFQYCASARATVGLLVSPQAHVREDRDAPDRERAPIAHAPVARCGRVSFLLEHCPPRLASSETTGSGAAEGQRSPNLPTYKLLRDRRSRWPSAAAPRAKRPSANHDGLRRWLSRKPLQPAFRCAEVTTARSRRRSVESNEGVGCCETALREVGPDLPGRAIVAGQQRDLFVRQPRRGTATRDSTRDGWRRPAFGFGRASVCRRQQSRNARIRRRSRGSRPSLTARREVGARSGLAGADRDTLIARDTGALDRVNR